MPEIFKFRFFFTLVVLIVSGCIFDPLFNPNKPDRTINLYAPKPDTLEDGSFSGERT